MAPSATAGAGGHGGSVLPALTVVGVPVGPTEKSAAPHSSVTFVFRRPGASRRRLSLSFADHHPAAGHAYPQRHRLSAGRSLSTLSRVRFFRTAAASSVAIDDSGEEPTAKELNQVDGAIPMMTALLVAETRKWRELNDNPALSAERRDTKLQIHCADATQRADVGLTDPISARLISMQGRDPDPLLWVVRALPPPPTTGVVPAAESIYAFAGAVAPHAGSSLSPSWLSAHIGAAVAAAGWVHPSPSSRTCRLSSALVQWGSTLYVGVAGRQWDD